MLAGTGMWEYDESTVVVWDQDFPSALVAPGASETRSHQFGPQPRPSSYPRTSMLAVRRYSSLLRPCIRPRYLAFSCRDISSKPAGANTVDFDAHGIPTRPTWSVNELLSSYPVPKITPATLKHLYELSALIPPQEGTPEHAKLTSEMENLVKLVEAVKLVDVGSTSRAAEGEVPDGRIWAEGTGIPLEYSQENASPEDKGEIHGQALLEHASRTENSLYVVDTSRPKR